MTKNMPRGLARIRRSPLAVLLAYFGLALLFFWRLWARVAADRMMIGAAEGDFLRQFYPYRAFVARAWGMGKPPLWNPHQYAGTPAWADPQLAVLYPWRWLQVPFGWLGGPLPLWTVELEAVAHVALGGFFTYLLLRRLGASPPAAGFAGLAFGFGGYLTGYPVEQLAVLDTAVWIPALLWALTGWMDGLGDARLDSNRSLFDRRFLLACAFMAMAVYAGHPQTALYALWAGIVWLLVRGRCAGLSAARHALAILAWLAAGAALSAAQWLPTASFLRRSARDIDPAEIAAGLPLGDWIQVLAPGVVSQWSPLYVGAVTLVLAAWGAARFPDTRPWAFLAFGAWTVALGGNGPLFPLYRVLLPGMTLFRHQERIAVLVSLGLAVAAGLALHRLLEADADSDAASIQHSALRWLGSAAGLLLFAGGAYALRFAGQSYTAPDFCAPGAHQIAAGAHQDPLAAGMAGPLLFSALVLALAALLLWMRSRGGLGRAGLAAGLLLLCAFELFSVNRGAALCPRTLDIVPDARLEALLPKARDGRISSEAQLPYGPNAASVFGLYDVTGDSPLQLGNVASLIDHAPEILWWRILNVRYALSDRPPEGAPLELLVAPEASGSEIGSDSGAPGNHSDSGAPGDHEDSPAALYAVQLPVPPVWLPQRLRCGPPGAPPEDLEALAILEREGATLNPLEWLVLDAEDQARFCPSAGESEAGTQRQPPSRFETGTQVQTGTQTQTQIQAQTQPFTGGTATLSGLDPGRITVDATLPQDGWLVLSTAYEPGWRLRAEAEDGRVLRPEIHQAYASVMALRLPAGAWRLTWTYLPIDVIMGLALSVLSLLAGAFLWRRSPSPRRSP